MLKLEPVASEVGRALEPKIDFLPQLDLLSVLRMFVRYWPRFLIVVAAFTALAAVYQLTSDRRYTAQFAVLVAVKDRDILTTNANTGATARIVDPGEIESQVEIVKSANVVRAAVRKLDLGRNAAFMAGGRSPLDKLRDWLRETLGAEATPAGDAELEEAAVKAVLSGVKPKRAGVTYVVEVEYTGPTPQLTLDIANALADAYLNSELQARYEASRRATQWFQDQLLELRREVSSSDFAVQSYKNTNNIVDTSHGLIDEAQLADVNSQFVAAQAATAEAKARLDRVEAVLNGDFTSAAVSDALKSDVITRLRAQYLDLLSRNGDLAQRLGPKHQVVVDLGRKMQEIAAAAKDELKRIAQSNRSDYEIARERELALRRSMDELIQKVGQVNKSQVALRNLESASQAYRNIYDAFLQKFQQSSQEQTVPFSTARLITPPVLPDHPSWPRSSIVLGAGVGAGAVAGFIVLVLTEMLNNGFKTAEDVRLYAGLEYLGTLPRVPIPRMPRAALARAEEGETVFGLAAPLTRHTVLEPFSRFTETVRNALVSIDFEVGVAGTPVVGVISALPKEGKTSIAANLAMLTAQLGRKTLILDGDLHTCSLTKALAPQAERGLLEALERGRIAGFVMEDAATGLHLLPSVVPRRLTNSAEILRSKAMAALLKEARERYDYVFVDLPPILPVIDAKAAVQMFDAFVYVIAWQRTTRDAVRNALLENEFVRQRVLGAFLNLADPAQLRRMESYRGYGYGNYYTKSEPSAAVQIASKVGLSKVADATGL